MTKKKKTMLNLLEQIIKRAEEEDLEYKKQMILAHKATKATGESWMCFHLKALRELLQNS